MPVPGEYWVALRADGQRGSGTISEPFDASSPTLFATVMNSFSEKSMIHLGPGIFQTFGYNGGFTAEGWNIKSGQRIAGAGMNATTLKVVDAKLSSGHMTAGIHSGSAQTDGFEVSDVTIDCNMRGHLGKNVSIGAIAFYGERVRLRRVQAVDFCTEGGPNGNLECFVITTNGNSNFPDPYDNIIEDCLVHRPCPNGAYTSSCLGVGGGGQAGGRLTFARYNVLRDNFVNCEYEDRRVAIAGITHSGSVATVTTKTPHARRTGDWVVVTGALISATEENPYNGSFQISVVDAQSFQYTLLWVPSPLADPTGEMWIGKRSSHPIGLKAFVPPGDLDPYNPGLPGAGVEQTGTNEWTVTIVTEKPHLRIPGNNVHPLVFPIDNIGAAFLPELAHAFVIREIPNPQKLKFVITSLPRNPSPNQSGAFINPGFNGMGADGGMGAIVHNNRVFNTPNSYYHDTGPSKDLTVKKNLFYAGIFAQSLGQFERARRGSISVAGTIATFICSTSHHLRVGDAVTIGDGFLNNLYSEEYDSAFWTCIFNDEIVPLFNGAFGTFEIQSVLSANRFTYKVPFTVEADEIDATATLLWQVRQLIVERNIVEQILHPFKEDVGFVFGMVIGTELRANPYVFPAIQLRRNIIQNIDQKVDLSGHNIRAVYVNTCGSAIVERNVMDINYPAQLIFTTTGRIKTLGNHTHEGQNIEAAYIQTGASEHCS